MGNKVYIQDNSSTWKDICGCNAAKADGTWGTVGDGDMIRDNLGNWITIDCLYWNDYQHQIFKRNNCSTGYSGTNYDYVVPAHTFSSTISKADANALALADITASGQTTANASASCIINNSTSTLTWDYFSDTSVDLCMFCSTPACIDEYQQLVNSVANGGPLQMPNDGRDPSACYALSSDKLAGPPVRRFAINMAYYIVKYAGIQDVIEWTVQGRGSSAIACNGVYALRDATSGHLIMSPYGGGLYIPSVSSGSLTVTSWSSHITSGANGTVGTGVGSPVFKFTYTISTNTLVVTTY